MSHTNKRLDDQETEEDVGNEAIQEIPDEEIVQENPIPPPIARNNDPRRQRLLGHMRLARPVNPNVPPNPNNQPRQRGPMLGQQRQRQPQVVPQNGLPPLPPLPQQNGVDGNLPPPPIQQQQAPPRPNRRAPPPPPPPLVLPNDPGDAIRTIMATADRAQETIRQINGQLFAVKADFIDQQDARRDGNDPQKAEQRMRRIVTGVQEMSDGCDLELARLLTLQQQLAQVAIDGQTLPAVVALHQKTTNELALRVAKARTLSAAGQQLATRLEAAIDQGPEFAPNDALPLYQPDAFELPAMLRTLTGQLQELTANFRQATIEIAPFAERVGTLFTACTHGNGLPEGAANELDVIEGAANDVTRPFGKWNATTIRSYKTVTGAVKQLDQPVSTELAELSWRLSSTYDVYSAAYGQADEAGKGVIHLVTQLRAMLAPPPANTEDAVRELQAHREQLERMLVTAGDPARRIQEKKNALPGQTKTIDRVGDARIGELQGMLVELNNDREAVRANGLALDRMAQQVVIVQSILDSRYAGLNQLKPLVTAASKAAGQVIKQVSPVQSDAQKTESGLTGLIDTLNEKLGALGPVASVEDTVRLQEALQALPPAPGKNDLFPPGGAGQAKAQHGQGGDRDGTKLFAAVTKAWDTVEKQDGPKALDALEQAASAYLDHHATLNILDPTDTARADKCAEALRQVRKLRLSQDRAALPPPPWSQTEVTEARRIEACTLLENGMPARPPGAKGESDSFFLKDSLGKAAFIFKPMQGENVKEGGREGEGVAREVLSSKFNDQMRDMIGVDFGVCPTGLARLESDSFDQGEKSQATSRMGALQQTAPNNGNLLQQCGNDPEVAKSIPTEDVQKIALLDFLTLQGDRNPENVLIKDEGGQKRLVPIDGGFAFPSTAMFNEYSVGMAAEPKGGKTGQIQGGNNGLMQLPQSDEKFTPEMLQAIEKIDPSAMVKGMRQANAEMVSGAPELEGMVGEENLENMRRSALFLKKAAPEFTVAQIAEIYAVDFKRILALRPNQVEKAIADILLTARARVDFNQQVKLAQKEYDDLGGDDELKQLGWDLNDRMLRLDWNRKIQILTDKEAAPPPPEKPEGPPQLRQEEKAERDRNEYEQLGGDRALTKLLQQRQDANYSPRVTVQSPLVMKLPRLRYAEELQDFGGDAAYKRLLELYQNSRYAPFDTLPKEGQAAVATFAASSWDPSTFDLMSKVTALREFAKYKG